ncbi:uncharacterized protein F5147DRAFT_805010 [Suillus discolor]|uniref:Uncharacterized protein n=1 Tax=Suillus discolor TaxID=1912936 RepID=A0A9P7F503_9AGAM|nr:uncharacterized protein F5147DRAFT_805010 [Suillus discolor]KAG2106246.1 hypothetical protein F5147DRAFT_805010 [Suillus discolor]
MTRRSHSLFGCAHTRHPLLQLYPLAGCCVSPSALVPSAVSPSDSSDPNIHSSFLTPVPSTYVRVTSAFADMVVDTRNEDPYTYPYPHCGYGYIFGYGYGSDCTHPGVYPCSSLFTGHESIDPRVELEPRYAQHTDSIRSISCRSERNLLDAPHLLSFFLNFVLWNRVLPKALHECSIHSALDIVELTKKELPLTYKIRQALHDVFSNGCKECFGCKGRIEWSFDDHLKATDQPAPGNISHLHVISPSALVPSALSPSDSSDLNRCRCGGCEMPL